MADSPQSSSYDKSANRHQITGVRGKGRWQGSGGTGELAGAAQPAGSWCASRWQGRGGLGPLACRFTQGS